MHIAILTRNKNLHSIRRLRLEAVRARVVCDLVNPLECQLLIAGNKHRILVQGKAIPHYDAILPRIGASITEYGVAVVRHFEGAGTHAVNGSGPISTSRDKFACLQTLSHAGVRTPITFLSRNTKDIKPLISETQGPPAVAKLLKGTQGTGVMLLPTAIALVSTLETFHALEKDVLVQEYLKDGAGKDYRVFVIGGKVVAAMQRTAPRGEFRANIHRGGEGKPVKLTKAYERCALKATEVLGLEIAGVDLMETAAGPVVLEVNSSPGFEGIEKATGLNVARLMMNHIIKTAKSQTAKRKKRSR